MFDGSDPQSSGDSLVPDALSQMDERQPRPQATEALSVEAIIKACRTDLICYVSAEEVLKRLRAIEAQALLDPMLYAQWLVAKGIAANRDGRGAEALGDLNEAADKFAQLNDSALAAEAKREAAVVHSWRGEGREAGLALLRALAENLAAKDMTGAALTLIQAGRLELEMDRPQAAVPLFDRALKIEGTELPVIQRQRAAVNQLQALVAAGRIDEALQFRQAMSPDLASAKRLHFLVMIEEIRCARAKCQFKTAHQGIDAARLLVRGDDSFEFVELAEAEAELALAEINFPLADAKLERVITGCAAQDLAGREVKARLMRAKALDGLGRTEEADQILFAALRRAIARNLVSHQYQVRTALALRGAPEEPPAFAMNLSPAAQDPQQRFTRERIVGAGVQGSVSRAYDIELGVEVALKTVYLEKLDDPAKRARLLSAARTEIMAASRIDHPGVARIRGLIVEHGGNATLIEDLIDGPTLDTIMKDPIGTKRALDLVKHIAYALSAIHEKGIVHCDLKPANIVLREPARPVIIDFGIALLGPGMRSSSGTPAYMAPEQKRGKNVYARGDFYALGIRTLAQFGINPKIDARTDLYALGIIALELMGIKIEIAGDFWQHDNGVRDRLHTAGVSPQCVDLMHRLVAPEKWRRPRSASEVCAIIH
jgi:tetratricopeptide (TPR) repeat protein